LKLNGSPNGQSEATTQQIEYAVSARELEDHRARDVDVPAMQETTPSALRVRQLRIL
jgi:hypothetical protein